jgi:uncharacterized protein YjaZ
LDKVSQLTPMDLYQHKSDLDFFLCKNLSKLVSEKTWMKDWKQIADRFQLNKFEELSKEEATAYSWDIEKVEEIIHETIKNAREHLSFDAVTVTVFPAIPFPWHKNLPQSMWTNGFTNGPNNIQIAIPPEPDEDFLCYMIAHELHHATPLNPIYDLTQDSFSLAEWFKMEGGAEFFSLSLYPDKRWWKDKFTSEVELNYWRKVKDEYGSTEGKTKNLFAFGNPKHGIPYMAGYAFAYHLFLLYMENYSDKTFADLLFVQPESFIENYQETRLGKFS